MTDAGRRDVQPEDLEAEDRAALGWAVSTEQTLGVEIVERARSGGSGFSAAELSAIRRDWDGAGRPPPAQHVHRTSVVFTDGTSVTGVTFLADDPYRRDTPPAFGLYLDERWSPPWPHVHVEWPDFGLPADIDAFRRALIELHERARRGEAVEAGCLGGHGRTGTALACFALLAGISPAEAVEWVRANYCVKAVETDEQEKFVGTFSPYSPQNGEDGNDPGPVKTQRPPGTASRADWSAWRDKLPCTK